MATKTALRSLQDVLDWFCDAHHSCGTCDFYADKIAKLDGECPVAALKDNIERKLEPEPETEIVDGLRVKQRTSVVKASWAKGGRRFG